MEIDMSERKTSHFNHLFPHKKLFRSLLLSLLTIVFSYLFFILLPDVLGVNTINHYIGFSIKVITAVIMSGIVGYVVIELAMDDYQNQQIISIKERN